MYAKKCYCILIPKFFCDLIMYDMMCVKSGMNYDSISYKNEHGNHYKQAIMAFLGLHGEYLLHTLPFFNHT